MIKKISLLILSFFILTSNSSFAQSINKQASEFKWKGTKVTGEHTGVIFLKSADIKTDQGQIVGGEFVMDISSFKTTDLQGDSATKLEGHLKSADFFDVAKYPTAKLVIENLTAGQAKGQLTIKDQTHPVTIAYTQNGSTYSGKLVFDRTKFGMIYGSGSFFKGLGDKMIHNDVELSFKVVLNN